MLRECSGSAADGIAKASLCFMKRGRGALLREASWGPNHSLSSDGSLSYFLYLVSMLLFVWLSFCCFVSVCLALTPTLTRTLESSFCPCCSRNSLFVWVVLDLWPWVGVGGPWHNKAVYPWLASGGALPKISSGRRGTMSSGGKG